MAEEIILHHYHQPKRKKMQLQFSLRLIGRCSISCIFVFLTQFALSLVPRCFSGSPLLLQFALSGLVLVLTIGLGSWCRRFVGLYASAPAFVFFNILFTWGVYVSAVRPVISPLLDAVFNAEVALLLLGLCSILIRDPGFVNYGSSCSDKLSETDNEELEALASGSCQESPQADTVLLKRVRYCKICKAYIKGFDHHCPAFGNCIGQNNYLLFVILLIGFLATESSYVVCASHLIRGSQAPGGLRSEVDTMGTLVMSTMLFSLLQVLWQALFLMWHVYCICFNIKTDEWINWRKYSEFHLVHTHPGEGFTRMMFKNPYDKGILLNVKEFLRVKE